jgi:hypothetical protein
MEDEQMDGRGYLLLLPDDEVAVQAQQQRHHNRLDADDYEEGEEVGALIASGCDSRSRSDQQPLLLQGLYLGLPPPAHVGPATAASFASLPEEVVAAVFAFLDRRSLLRAAATCHRWNRIASDDALWRPLFFLQKRRQLLVNGGDEEDDAGNVVDADGVMAPSPPAPLFLHAPARSWRAAEAWQLARDSQWRALVADRDREAEAVHERMQRMEEDVHALTVCCEGLEAEQALRFEAELALRSARAELEDASYELMGRTHRLEEKTEEAARLARALVVAEKGREEEKRRADALEREARALRERCEAAERSLDLAAQRWIKEKKTREELLDLLGREQRSRSDLTRETIAALFKQLLAPSSPSPSPLSAARLAPSSSLGSASSSSSSGSGSLALSALLPAPPLGRSTKERKNPATAGQLAAITPKSGSISSKPAPSSSFSSSSSAMPPSTSPPKSSLLPPAAHTKCNF